MFFYADSSGKVQGSPTGAGIPFDLGLTDTDSNYGFGTYNFLNPDTFGNYFNSMKSEQEALWAREDSAHQREVEDLKKAGLNPWLSVTGNGLSTSASVSPTKNALETIIQLLALSNEATSKKDANNQWIGNLIAKIGLGILKAL